MRLALLAIAAVIALGGPDGGAPAQSVPGRILPFDSRPMPSGPTPQTTARPIVELEKTHFDLGERVFFWIGVTGGTDGPIPRALWTTGRVILTRPDGTERIETTGWPMDGMGTHGPGDLGWRGGHGLGAEAPQPGRWIVEYEFAGHRSAPAELIIVDAGIVRQIDAAFAFSASPLVIGAAESDVTLVVHNRSAEAIRFPVLGHLGTNVSAGLDKRSEPRWGSSFFVPDAVLLAASGTTRGSLGANPFTWDLADRVPVVVVAPGDTYRLRLPLSAVLEQAARNGIPVGEYDFRVSTELHLLVGARDGRWKPFDPIRLAVTSRGIVVRR